MADDDQVLGPKSRYLYKDDHGVDYVVLLDSTLGSIAGLGLTAAPATTTATKIIQGLEMRKVHWVNDATKARKHLVCNAAGTLYNVNSSTAVPIGGAAGHTTGRTGEKCRF